MSLEQVDVPFWVDMKSGRMTALLEKVNGRFGLLVIRPRVQQRA
jgi:hypothetical protein